MLAHEAAASAGWFLENAFLIPVIPGVAFALLAGSSSIENSESVVPATLRQRRVFAGGLTLLTGLGWPSGPGGRGSAWSSSR